MDPKKLFFDERFRGLCAYCGAFANTRDHVPSKVLLDEPYPANLPVIDACEACNNAFSKDEPYLACLLDCVIHGTSLPTQVGRDKVKRILADKPHLAKEIESNRRQDDEGNMTWLPDNARTTTVILKLARGHAAYEFAEPSLDAPEHVIIAPLMTFTTEQRDYFEHDESPGVDGWPEIGSRAFCRLVVSTATPFWENGWNDVQSGRYRYLALPGPVIRIVLSEYLACEIAW